MKNPFDKAVEQVQEATDKLMESGKTKRQKLRELMSQTPAEPPRRSSKKPTAEQARVMRMILRFSPPGSQWLQFYQGGFWSPPGMRMIDRGDYEAPDAYTTVGTVRAMEERGWLRPVPGTGYNGNPNLEHRELTEEGKQIAAKLP